MVVHIMTTFALSIDELEKLERVLKRFVSYSKQQDNDVMNSMETDLNFFVTEEDSELCGKNAKQQYQKCLRTTSNGSNNQKEECSKVFVTKYSKCFFGQTLNHGSKNPSLCDSYCTFNHDKCSIFSDRIELFICIAARDKCKSHCKYGCETAADSAILNNNKRECRNSSCGRFKNYCLRDSSEKNEKTICRFAEMLCLSDCNRRH